MSRIFRQTYVASKRFLRTQTKSKPDIFSGVLEQALSLSGGRSGWWPAGQDG